MKKKGIIVTILVGIVCVCLGGLGSYFIFGYGKDNYEEIVEELDELKNKEKKTNIAHLKNGEETIVILNNGEITAFDLYNLMKNTTGVESLIDLIDKKILEEKYKDRLDDANNYVDEIIEYYESAYGNHLLTVLQSNGFSSIEHFKNKQYLAYLENLAVDDYCKEQIKDAEVKKYYQDEYKGDINISHILITTNGSNEEETKNKAEAIIAELNKTNKEEITNKFASLAKEYSQDDSTKEKGGSLGFINKNTLNSFYDEMVEEAYRLKDGEYSTKVIKTDLGYHIILRTETKEKASFEEAKDDILKILGAEYLKNNLTMYVKALQKLREENGLEFVDTELEKQYSNYNKDLIKSYEAQQKYQDN